MTKAEAEQFARRCLYNYRENAARLEQKIFKAEIMRERGSRVIQQFDERGGKAGAGYVDSIPCWLEGVEFLEAEIIGLKFRVPPITRLLRDLEAARQGELIVYRLKYEQRLSWNKAKAQALDAHNIADKLFRSLNNSLISTAVAYLDLRIQSAPKTGPEIGPEIGLEMGLENPKSV